MLHIFAYTFLIASIYAPCNAQDAAAKAAEIKRLDEQIKKDEQLKHAIQGAAAQGKLNVLKKIMLENDALSINQHIPDAVETAALNQHLEVMKLLLDFQKDNVDQKSAASALRYAAQNNDIKAIACLLQYNVNINGKTKSGGTALGMAAERGHVETVKYLLDNGANIEQKESSGASSLDWAALREHSDVIKTVLQHSKAKSPDTHYVSMCNRYISGITITVGSSFPAGWHNDGIKNYKANRLAVCKRVAQQLDEQETTPQKS